MTAVATADGVELARAESSACNLRTLGYAEAARRLVSAVTNVLRFAPVGHLRSLAIGMAGTGHGADRDAVAAAIGARLPGVAVRIVADAWLVLLAGTADGRGLAVVSGTGSIAYGRDHADRVVRAGGWGSLLGDPGSGFAIGRAALAAAADAADGLRPASLLAQRLGDRLAEFELAGTSPDPSDVAGLVPFVVEAARAGDGIASTILSTAAADLARYTEVVTARLAWGDAPIPVALAGGVLIHVPEVRTALETHVRRMIPAVGPITVVDSPVAGALQLAVPLASPSGAR